VLADSAAADPPVGAPWIGHCYSSTIKIARPRTTMPKVTSQPSANRYKTVMSAARVWNACATVVRGHPGHSAGPDVAEKTRATAGLITVRANGEAMFGRAMAEGVELGSNILHFEAPIASPQRSR